MDDKKLSFLQGGLFDLLKNLHAGSTSRWGKMNAQQMIEHTADFFDVSAEKLHFDLVTPPEHLPKYKEFLLSDKDFRENTKAPASVLGEEPLPLKHACIGDAIKSLHTSVAGFMDHFKSDPLKTTLHPVFGPLDFNEWVLLHYKHATHHLRQFGLI